LGLPIDLLDFSIKVKEGVAEEQSGVVKWEEKQESSLM